MVYLFQPVTVHNADGTPDTTSWLVLDEMVVGADGMMHTTSGPYLGLASYLSQSTANFGLVPSVIGQAFAGSPSILGAVQVFADTSLRQQTFGSGVASMQTVLGQGGGESGPRYYVVSSPLGDMLVPAVLNSFYRFTGLAASANGLVSILGEDISVLPGAIKSIAIPLPPAFLVNNITPPTLTGRPSNTLIAGSICSRCWRLPARTSP